jgi:signal transduction histidine kinase
VKHLTTRLVILIMLALMVITGVNDYTRLVGERERLVAQLRDDERIFTETLALAVRQNVRRGRTTDELEELLEDILTRPGLVAVAIFNPEGSVVAQKVATGFDPPTLDDTIRGSLERREASSTLLERPSGRFLRYVQPFRWPGGRIAAIEVRHTLGEMERQFRRAVRDSVASRLLVLVLFVLSVVALTRWSIARPIRALIAAAQAVGGGDLSQRIAPARRDEIGQLAEEFNRMATNLQTAHAELVRQGEERLRLEQEAQQAQKMAAVGMLAAEVAHEIGTPLNVISGRAEVLTQAIPHDHAERRHLDVILKQTERISRTIRSLLDYTRPRRPQLRATDVVSLLGRVANLLLERSRRQEVRILLDVTPGLPRIAADPDQVQQVLLNLLLNALDASAPGKSIRLVVGPEPELPPDDRMEIVRGKADGPCLAIHVIDAGRGLSGEQLDHIFEPFFSTKDRGHGTGLGLPIVEEIVRAHRGEIAMLSIPGRGTEAIVRLPLAPEDTPLTDPLHAALGVESETRS